MRKYLSEGLLIVFSVLFALGINSFVENRQTLKKKVTAIESLEQELEANRVIIERWVEKHQYMQERLSSVAFGKNDSLKTALKKYHSLNLGILFENANLIDELLRDTTWETVKTTGIISELDFKTIKHLTDVYNLQTVITDVTIQRLIDNFYDKETLDTKNLDGTLIQLSLMMSELVGQEKIIPQLYDEALKALEKEKR